MNLVRERGKKKEEGQKHGQKGLFVTDIPLLSPQDLMIYSPVERSTQVLMDIISWEPERIAVGSIDLRYLTFLASLTILFSPSKPNNNLEIIDSR
jgi:hypothetical protein